MNRKVYCACDSDFTSHFSTQAGRGFSDIEVFRGQPHQRGYGIGSLIKRVGIPILKALGKHLLKTGVNAGQDILSHGNIKQAIKTSGKQGVKAAEKDGLDQLGRLVDQDGSGIRKRKRATELNKKAYKKSKRKKTDIFN